MGGTQERAQKGRKEIYDLYDELVEKCRKMYEDNGRKFVGEKQSSYIEEISEKTGYSTTTVRIRLNERERVNKKIRNEHKRRVAACR